MEEKWHVSDSEGEDCDRDRLPNNKNCSSVDMLMLPRSTASLSKSKSSNSCSNYSIPQNLVSLYERISNEGFIALHCKAERRFCERHEEDTKAEADVIAAAALSSSSTDTNDTKCINDIDTAGSVQHSGSKNVANNKRKANVVEFDFEEESFETSFTLPRKNNKKSGPDRFKRSKRVGTMENVINDLNRIEELNAQMMENQNQ